MKTTATISASALLIGVVKAYYPVTGASVLNCRSGPSTSDSVTGTYNEGDEIDIRCQTEGTSVEGYTVWDKTQDDCYISDYYVETGESGYITDKCGDDGGGDDGGDDGGDECGTPSSNSATVDLIAEFEGFIPDIYSDPAGYATVGYGHLCDDSSCSEVPYSIPLSESDGKKLLADDMVEFEDCITGMISSSIKVNANEFGAMVSWSFNMGCGAAEESSLIARINDGEDVGTVLEEELPEWVHAGDEVLPGLVRRRDAEIDLALTSTDDGALPPC